MQFDKVNICQVMIFRLYTVYNKHKMIKIGNQNQKKKNASARIFLLLTVDLTKNRKYL